MGERERQAQDRQGDGGRVRDRDRLKTGRQHRETDRQRKLVKGGS